MCKIKVDTNQLNIWYTCEDCNITLQNPVPAYPVEFLEEHDAVEGVLKVTQDDWGKELISQ